MSSCRRPRHRRRLRWPPTGIPHIWWIHEFTTLAGQKRYAFGEPLAQRLIGRLSNRVAVNSRAVARYYSPPIPPEKLRIVELGVDAPAVAPNCVDAIDCAC